VGKSEGDHQKDLHVGWRVILKWISDMMEWCGLNSSGSGLGHVAGFCVHFNEPSDSRKNVGKSLSG
jgi:hypothetical protein